jgi:hypothetical protein
MAILVSTEANTADPQSSLLPLCGAKSWNLVFTEYEKTYCSKHSVF